MMHTVIELTADEAIIDAMLQEAMRTPVHVQTPGQKNLLHSFLETYAVMTYVDQLNQLLKCNKVISWQFPRHQ